MKILQQIKDWLLKEWTPCSTCKYCDKGKYQDWCVLQYKGTLRGRQEDSDCKPQGILWERRNTK